MAHLFPHQAKALAERVQENAESRLWAGIHYRSDIEAGLALGRAVVERVIDWSRKDGSR